MAGGSKSSSKSTDMTPEAFKALQGPFASVMGGLIGQTQTPGGGWQNMSPGNPLSGIPKYQGPLTAGIGGNEQSILDMLMGSANGTTQTSGPTGEAQSYLSRVMGGEFLDAGNPFLQSAITAAQRPMLQGLEETLSRVLPGRFTEAGQFKQPGSSSAFDRAAAIATRGTADAMSDVGTKMSYQNYSDERTRQNEAAGLTATIQTQEVDNLVKNLQAQALPRLIEEFGIERGIEQFNNQINTLLATLGIAGGVTAPTIGQKSESKTKPNIVGPALGAAVN